MKRTGGATKLVTSEPKRSPVETQAAFDRLVRRGKQKQIGLVMNWEKVNEFVETWVAEQQLPTSLKGRTLTLVDFNAEPDCQYFYPGRTLLAQKAFTSALAKWARARHARTEHITIAREHYRHWLTAERLEDSEKNRGRFIESRYKVLPAA